MIRPVASFFCLFLSLLGSPAQIPSQMPAAARLPSLNLRADTVLFAELTTDLNLRQSKPAEGIRAEITQDVTQGKAIVLWKGTIVAGQVAFFEPTAPGQPDNMVGIQFDRVKPKKSPEQSLHVIVRALAPHARPTANAYPGVPHPADAGIEPLNESSVGVSNIPGLRLGVRKSGTGQETTVLAWSKGDVRVRRGSQLVLSVVRQ